MPLLPPPGVDELFQAHRGERGGEFIVAQVAVAVIVEMRHDVGGQRLDLGARKRNRRGLRRRRRRQVVDLLDRV
jgi:hypothetical protein